LIKTNLKPRFVRSELKLTYKNYFDLMPQQAICTDMITAFRDNLIAFNVRCVSEAKINHEKKEERLNKTLNLILPIDDWKATSI
jgi:hypothetical protein